MNNKYEKNKLIAKLAYFFIILIAALLIDLLLKQFVYKDENMGVKNSWVIIGWSSLPNYDSTFLNFIKISLPLWAHIFTSVFIILLIFTAIIFTKKKYVAICLALIAAGVFGNTIDRVAFGYVRDILYIPWIRDGNSGVFNFADMFVVFGSIFWGLITVIEIWKK